MRRSDYTPSTLSFPPGKVHFTTLKREAGKSNFAVIASSAATKKMLMCGVSAGSASLPECALLFFLSCLVGSSWRGLALTARRSSVFCTVLLDELQPHTSKQTRERKQTPPMKKKRRERMKVEVCVGGFTGESVCGRDWMNHSNVNRHSRSVLSHVHSIHKYPVGSLPDSGLLNVLHSGFVERARVSICGISSGSQWWHSAPQVFDSSQNRPISSLHVSLWITVCRELNHWDSIDLD